jgi:hypothetical protein
VQGKIGLEILANVVRNGQGFVMNLSFRNIMIPGTITINMVNLLPNCFGFSGVYNGGPFQLQTGSFRDLQIPLAKGMSNAAYTPLLNLQVMSNFDNYSLGVSVYPHLLSNMTSPVTIDEFKSGWMSGQPFQADQTSLPQLLTDEERLKAHFRNNGITHLSTQNVSGSSRCDR